MKKVVINRRILLQKIKDNLKEHIKTYKSALVAYKKYAPVKVKEQYEDVLKGLANDPVQIKFVIVPPLPVSHEEDYNKVIAMLELSVEKDIVLEVQEFSQYVQDEWTWKNTFTTTSNNYITGCFNL